MYHAYMDPRVHTDLNGQYTSGDQKPYLVLILFLFCLIVINIIFFYNYDYDCILLLLLLGGKLR
jgi:hypothetical protein